MKSDSQLPIIGMDIAKNVFQLHIVVTGKIYVASHFRGEISQKNCRYGCRDFRFGPVWIRFEKYKLSQLTVSAP